MRFVIAKDGKNWRVFDNERLVFAEPFTAATTKKEARQRAQIMNEEKVEKEEMEMIVHSDFSGHSLCVTKIPAEQVPLVNGNRFQHQDAYFQFWVVQNFDRDGWIFFYIGKGHKEAPNEYVVWYPNGKMWSSYGKTIKEAIEGAQKDGWKYAV